MLIKSIHFNDLQHSTVHYWTPLDMAEVDALSAKKQKRALVARFSFLPGMWPVRAAARRGAGSAR